MIFDKKEILNTIDEGIKGNAINCTTGFKKMEEDGLKIFPSCYTVIGGFPGSGKSAYFYEAYIHNPYDWWYNAKKKGETDIELYWILYLLERPLIETKLKWIARKIFLDTVKVKKPILLDVQFLRGFKKSKVTNEVYDLVIKTFDYYEEMFSYMEIHTKSINPTGIYRNVQNYANTVGKIIEEPYTTRDGIEKFHKKYIKNNPKRITIIGIDHLGKLKGETVEGQYYKPESRELIAKMSEYISSEFRDFYGFSSTIVSQFNRNIENTARFGNGVIIPQPSDFKNSSNPYEDSDIVLALFNPHKVGECMYEGYNLRKMISTEGKNRFRASVTLKNSYGTDDIGYGLAFYGECGFIIELPKGSEMTEQLYNKYANLVFNN